MRNSWPFHSSAFLRCPAGLVVPVNLAECISASVKCEAKSELPETLFFSLQLKLLKRHMTMKDVAGRHMLSRCGLFTFDGFLVRFNIWCI